MRNVVIIGAGGHAQVVADILLCAREAGDPVSPTGYLDDDLALAGQYRYGLPVLGTLLDLPHISHDAVIVAIGDNQVRRRVFDRLLSAHEELVVARHPKAIVARDVVIGAGTVICAGVVVNPGSLIGADVILNTASSVDHHNRIGDHAHVAPGAHLGGGVTVGEGALVGIGATVLPGAVVGAWSIVGGGACVIGAVCPGSVVVGIPARVSGGGLRTIMSVPMSGPDLSEVERSAVAAVLDTPILSIGPRVEAFEQSIATYCGARYAAGVNSGTSGLHLCVIAAGVEAGDLVITTPFSFIASANSILYERGVPVFVDVDPATGNIDPVLAAEAADDLRRGGPAAVRWLPPVLRDQPAATRGRPAAILPVHAFGQPADMDPIMGTARRHDLRVIEDACEALGAEYKGRKAGTFGDAAVFAFYPNKQITTGEGGMIVTDREAWAQLFRSLRNQGRDVFDAWLNHTRLGYNYRLDEMSAALGLAQMGRIEDLLARRERVAAWYNERLAGAELVETPYIAPTTSRMSWFVYVVRIKSPANRGAVMARLVEAGIPSRPYFTPIHLQPFYRQRYGYEPGDFPVTAYLGEVSLALPFSSVMSESQVDQVCSALLAAVQPTESR